MWFSLFLYNHKSFTRSLKFIPQILFFITALAVIYYQRTDNISSSYSLAIVFLFATMAWLTSSFINVEDPVQRGVTILHTKNVSFYYLSKLIYMFCVNAIFSILSILLPVIIHAFGKPVLLKEIWVIFLCHLAGGFMGISIGLFFDSRILGNKKFSTIMLLLMLLISTFASKLLLGEFSGFYAFFLSPVGYLVESVSKITSPSVADMALLSSFYVDIYSFFIISVYISIAIRLSQC